MDINQVKQELKQWIATTNGSIQPDQLTDDLAILEQRIIKSVHVMDLILLLEHLRGKPVAVDQIQPGAFASVSAIMAAFFADID